MPAATATATEPISLRDEEADLISGHVVERTRLRLLWENDSWGTESDRFYTNGAGLGITLPESSLSRAIGDGLSWLPFRPDHVSGTATEFFLRQDMYTPEDFRTPNPNPTDRPYAGWLHLDTHHRILTLSKNKRRDRLDAWQLQLGIVGPAARAEGVQRYVHERVNSDEPRGWDTQLDNEPGIVLGYDHLRRVLYDPEKWGRLEQDVLVGGGARLGNVETNLRLEATLRLGFNLPRDFRTGLVEPGLGDTPMRFYGLI